MRNFITKTLLLGIGIGVLQGMLIFAAVRFFTYSPKHTHYHANFAVFINGERQQFKGFQYYEDVAACSAYDEMTPKKRVHMHNNVNDSVHVHDEGVTWGAFFQNLGWAIGSDYIKTDEQLYTDDDTNKLSFVLNGQDQPDVTNMVVGNKDRLLVSFGDETDEELDKRFEQVAHTAHKHNQTQDPASCSGDEEVSVKDRFRHIFDTK